MFRNGSAWQGVSLAFCVAPGLARAERSAVIPMAVIFPMTSCLGSDDRKTIKMQQTRYCHDIGVCCLPLMRELLNIIMTRFCVQNME